MDKSISEMTEDEILHEIEMLRVRRQEASIRKIVERATKEREVAVARASKKGDLIDGKLGAALDDILGGDSDE